MYITKNTRQLKKSASSTTHAGANINLLLHRIRFGYCLDRLTLGRRCQDPRLTVIGIVTIFVTYANIITTTPRRLTHRFSAIRILPTTAATEVAAISIFGRFEPRYI